MLETLSVRPRICDQIRSGPLGRWVDDFVDVLVTRGYAASTVRRYVTRTLKRLKVRLRARMHEDVHETSVDGSNPAISGHRKAGHFRRPETAREFYFMGSRTRKDLSLVKPGPPGP